MIFDLCFGVTKSNSLRPPPPTSLSLLLWPTNPISLMHFCEEQSQILPVLHCEASRHGTDNGEHEHGRQRPSERAIEGAPLPTSAPLCKLTAAVLSARSSSRRRRRPRRRRRQRPKARATLKEIKPRTDGPLVGRRRQGGPRREDGGGGEWRHAQSLSAAGREGERAGEA